MTDWDAHYGLDFSGEAMAKLYEYAKKHVDLSRPRPAWLHEAAPAHVAVPLLYIRDCVAKTQYEESLEDGRDVGLDFYIRVFDVWLENGRAQFTEDGKGDFGIKWELFARTIN